MRKELRQYRVVPPKGFELDSDNTQSDIKLPSGFTLDEVSSSKKKVETSGNTSNVSAQENTASKLSSGVSQKNKDALAQLSQSLNKGQNSKEAITKAIQQNVASGNVVTKSRKLNDAEVEKEAAKRLANPNNKVLLQGDDPIGNLSNAIQNSKQSLVDPNNLSAPTEHDVNEQRIHDKMSEILNQNAFSSAKEASDYLASQVKKVTGKDVATDDVNVQELETILPKNATTEAAIKKYANNRFIKSIMNESKNFGDFIERYKNNSNNFLHLNKDDESQQAQAYQQILSDPDVIEVAKSNPEKWKQYLQERHNFNNKFPELAKQELATKISQYREDAGKNNKIFNNPSKKDWDAVVEEMYKKGKVDASERAFYNQNINPSDLATTGLLESTLRGYVKATNDIGATIGFDKLGLATPSEKLPSVNPTNNKILGGGGELIGNLVPMLLGGAELKAAGYGAKIANSIPAILQFGGSNARKSKEYFPNSPLSQFAYTALGTSIDALLMDLPMRAQNGIKQLISGEIKAIAPKLSDNAISDAVKEQMKQSFLNKFSGAAKRYGIDILKHNAQTAGVLTGIDLLHRGLNLAAGDKAAFDNIDVSQQAIDNFLMATPLSALSALGALKPESKSELHTAIKELPDSMYATPLKDALKSGDINSLGEYIKNIAEQLNSSESGASTTRKVFGDKLSDIALKLYPDAKPAEIKSDISGSESNIAEVDSKPVGESDIREQVDNSRSGEGVGDKKGVTVFKNEETTAVRNDKNHTTYDINSDGKKIGSIAINYREDLGGYQIESSKVDTPRFGIGTEAYKKLINELDKPLISDSSLTDAAKGVWRKLENEGLAKYDEKIGKYISVKEQPSSITNTEQPKQEVSPSESIQKVKPKEIEVGDTVSWNGEKFKVVAKNGDKFDLLQPSRAGEPIRQIKGAEVTDKEFEGKYVKGVQESKPFTEAAQEQKSEQPPIETPPPIEPPKEEAAAEEKGGGKDKGILNRLVESKNISEETKKGLEERGLKYQPTTHAEAEKLSKAVVDEMGIDDAVLHAEARKLDDGVNSAVFAESLNRLYEQELNAKTPEEKLAAATKFADISDRYDNWARSAGREISQINNFYKKSPLGIVISENAKRKEGFAQWSKPKEKSWKEFFDEMRKEPEFEKMVQEQVKEGMKKERAEARKARIDKVDKTIDKWIDDIEKGGAMYSSVIPPKLVVEALKGMKKAYHAGEAVGKVIQDAIDYINDKMGGEKWDEERFRKKAEEMLAEKEPKKKALTDEELKAKILDKFRKKLKGLSDKEKEEVVRRAFKEIIENGGLEYEDFKKIISDVTGRGEMTPDEAKRIKELVAKTNEVEQAAKNLREQRTEEAYVKYRASMLETAKATKELNEMLWNKPNIMRRLTSIMQLNTLGIPSLINNPIYNIWNQMLVRFPVGIVNDAVDRGLALAAKMVGKDYQREYNVWGTQAEFFKGLGLGTKESLEQFLTGLNRQDLFQKEIYGQQIRPFKSLSELFAWKMGKKSLTPKQVVDKSLQATVGVPAEIVARVLNIGDKPQRFAAESAQGAAFAKALGLKGMDAKLFMEFPREEAYRAYTEKGLGETESAKKAEYIKSAIEQEGKRSTFQQDNMLNDLINKVFGGEKSGIGQFAKSLTVSPFIKIPSNAFWSAYNLINPEVAILQAMWHGAKAYKGRGRADNYSAMQLREARYWFAHAVTGIALRAAILPMVQAGIFNSSNTQDDTKKEREGEQNYEQQGAINLTKLAAYLRGDDPSKIEGGLTIQNRWLGQFGVIGNSIARKYDEMTPEQRQAQVDFWDAAFGGLEKEGLAELQNGVFSNTSAILQSLNSKGSFGADRYFRNTIGMLTNTLHPAAFAQKSRQDLSYVPQYKADDFLAELKNDMLTRSSWLRKLTGQYPPSKISIWGEPLKRPDNTMMRMFGISKTDKDAFAYPIYKDVKRTGDIGFFPPAVMPNLNGQKLNIKEQSLLETYIGQARKSYVAPYVNDGAYLEGFNKKYSELDDETKKKALSYLYTLGRIEGVKKFVAENPKYETPDKTEMEEEANQAYGDFKESLKE